MPSMANVFQRNIVSPLLVKNNLSVKKVLLYKKIVMYRDKIIETRTDLPNLKPIIISKAVRPKIINVSLENDAMFDIYSFTN